MPLTDEAALRLFLQGNGAGLEQLVRTYTGPLYGFLFQLVKDRAVAEDLVQETWIRIWKNAARFQVEKKFKVWLFAIGKNVAYDFLRKKKSLPFSFFDEEARARLEAVPDPGPLPETLLMREDVQKSFAAILARMTPPYRALLILHYQEELSLEEIATLLAEPYNTVKSRHGRAIRALRALLAQDASFWEPGS